ncbi:hypothetical protein Q4575_05645 [Psychrosphaera sp. 1_MG-2023]|uniref:hypothetical protein n=1 Tax=Psychrosphaera sp. 1_MG-2023 TaxID=3062643 RepID=UPI0026E15C04|nr:hypothetical protein [Psychrosphaera sp. 1_MG-2023]MDO6718874.1 hypothetical protein [Psychrosphaera sp. 1_MG-2023]
MKKQNKLLQKATLASLLLGLSFSSAVQAQDLSEKKLKSVKRDLNIMTTIIKTAINGNENSRNSRSHRSSDVEGIYLANQGMVFTIGSRHGVSYSFSRGHHSVAPIAPVPPIPPIIRSSAPLSEDDVDRIEESTMEAVELAMDMAEVQMEFYSEMDWSHRSSQERSEGRAEQNELEKQRRELEREARKLERNVRDIERKIRDAEYQQELNASADNKKKIAKLEAEMKQQSENLTNVAKEISSKAELLQKKASEMREKQIAQLNARIKVTETAISQAVCDFGGGLRSLAKGEHITFNLKGRSDRLYIFDMPSIYKCADGDITATDLLNKAVQYSL